MNETNYDDIISKIFPLTTELCNPSIPSKDKLDAFFAEIETITYEMYSEETAINTVECE